MDWDCVSNADFVSDCIVGFFRNSDPTDPDGLDQRFGILTAVKNERLGEYRYEEQYGRCWRHFRPALQAEVTLRMWKKGRKD